jgi:hypothetical protein
MFNLILKGQKLACYKHNLYLLLHVISFPFHTILIRVVTFGNTTPADNNFNFNLNSIPEDLYTGVHPLDIE